MRRPSLITHHRYLWCSISNGIQFIVISELNYGSKKFTKQPNTRQPTKTTNATSDYNQKRPRHENRTNDRQFPTKTSDPSIDRLSNTHNHDKFVVVFPKTDQFSVIYTVDFQEQANQNAAFGNKFRVQHSSRWIRYKIAYVAV